MRMKSASTKEETWANDKVRDCIPPNLEHCENHMVRYIKSIIFKSIQIATNIGPDIEDRTDAIDPMSNRAIVSLIFC